MRIKTVLSRFGITSKRLERKLDRYSSITGKFGCVPTFPIPAVILKRHPNIFRKPGMSGVELAVHGYIHTDHSSLSFEEQTRDFKKAIDTFKSYQIPFTGFRAPYLRINDRTPQALATVKFLYDSSHIICWDVIDKAKYPKQKCRDYERLLAFYQPQSAQEHLALPRLTNGLVEIPVSIPDDEAMVDRLGITDRSEISEIWKAILQRTYDRGELFTVQLHPERISFCESALTDILQQARGYNPPIWVATLGEIAGWWKERDKFSFEVHPEGRGTYRVKTNCSEKATLLLKNCRVNAPFAEWAVGYQSINAGDFVVESPVRPVIGMGIDSSPKAVSFLKSEGFAVELSDQPDNYGIYLTNLADFQEADEKPLSEVIEHSNAPLVRYWRWPNQAKSALAITGDIDSITMIDFVLRIFETWRQKRGLGANSAKEHS